MSDADDTASQVSPVYAAGQEKATVADAGLATVTTALAAVFPAGTEPASTANS